MNLEPLPDLLIAPIVRAALAEDLGRAGDITAQACVPADARLPADFAPRRGGVVARERRDGISGDWLGDRATASRVRKSDLLPDRASSRSLDRHGVAPLP